MISLQNVSKSFSGIFAVYDVSFEVNRGDVLGFLGPNGAGKTTTMRMIAGCLAPTAGAITIGGRDIVHNPVEIKKMIGYMPENNPLYQDMTVAEYLSFRARLKGVSKNRLKSRLEYVFDTCVIAKVAHKLIGVLSKGYRQRVGLADALVHDPQILILDEPTVGLDPAQIKQVRELIRSIGEDRTVILSTHILPEVEATCNRVVIINEGRIQATETTANLRKFHQTYQNVLSLEIKGNIEQFEQKMDSLGLELRQISQTDISSHYSVAYDSHLDHREDIFQAAVSAGAVILELSTEQTALEDVFIHLVTDEKTEENRYDG